MLPITKFLSRLIGLSVTLIVLPIALRRQAATDTLTAIVHNPALLFTLGMAFVIAGLAIVLTHNVWSGGALPVIVTLAGWITLMRGMLLLSLSPETLSRLFEAIHFEQLFFLYVAVSLAVGAYLIYGGFRSAGGGARR